MGSSRLQPHHRTRRIPRHCRQIQELSETNSALWRGKNIGIVFQFFQLIPTLSILENILLAMEFGSVIERKNREARAVHLLTRVGITSHRDKLPAALSGREQQRAAIARAIAKDPSVVIADEPTGNLDSHNDLQSNPGKAALVLFALCIGLWGVGTILVSWAILSRDLRANFLRTSPAHVVLTSKDFQRLDLEAFKKSPLIESAEFRALSFHRVEDVEHSFLAHLIPPRIASTA